MAKFDANHDDHDRRGLTELARSILDHGSDYAEARLELAKLEAEDAGEHIRGVATRLGIGAFFAIAGYCALLLGGIGLLAKHLLDGNWELPAVIAGAVHLFLGTLFLLGAKRQIRNSGNLFNSTKLELNKDLQWLKQKTSPEQDDHAPS